jgi:hypothetical protein
MGNMIYEFESENAQSKELNEFTIGSEKDSSIIKFEDPMDSRENDVFDFTLKFKTKKSTFLKNANNKDFYEKHAKSLESDVVSSLGSYHGSGEI